MKISKLQLKNFKRFSDLTIDLSQDGEPLPKLVLLIGANGSGKSGVFDAFEFTSKFGSPEFQTELFEEKREYYAKNRKEDTTVDLQFDAGASLNTTMFEEGGVISDSSSIGASQNLFYGRTAVRNLSRPTKTSNGNTSVIIEENRDQPLFFIDVDSRFKNDLDVYIKNFLDLAVDIYFESEEDQQKLATSRGAINKVKESLNRIFGENEGISLEFIKPGTMPVEGLPIDLIFRKGQSEISYDLLSSGEKEVINTIFNLYARTPHFQDTIYFFDELDAHLHTSLQYALIKEVVENWIPDNCQVWIATHSLGFIKYAHESFEAKVIDFDHLNFDDTIELRPEVENSVFEIAVPADALATLFKDKKLIYCENQNVTHYNSLGLEGILFVRLVDKTSIVSRIDAKKGDLNTNERGLIDRDFLSDADVRALKSKLPHLSILHYYCFENYLFHPENIKEVITDFDTQAYVKKIREKKEAKSIEKLKYDRKSYFFFSEEFNNKEYR